jgi:hypothetical protein
MTYMTMGAYKNHADADTAINELRASGIPSAEISYVYSDGDVIKNETTGATLGGDVAGGATTGAVLGALAGLAVANGILPGLGTLFVAGPIAAALGFTGAAATTVAGAATGLAAGGLIGALAHLGVSKEDAVVYEDLIRKGDVLVIAKSESGATKDIFLRTNASDIKEYSV